MTRTISKLLLAALLLLLLLSVTVTTAEQFQTTERRGGASTMRRRIARLSTTTTEQVTSPQQQVTTTTTSVTAAAEAIRQQQQQPLLSQEVLVSTFAFLNGISDVICQKRHGCYANLMTGNLIQLCSSIAEGQAEQALKVASLLLSFMAGVGLRQRLGSSVVATTALPWIAVPLLCASEVCFRMTSNMNTHITIMLLALAGGLVNSFASKETGNTVVFAVTGHLTRLGNGIVEGQLPKSSVLVVLFFGLGIGITTALYDHIHSLPLFALLSIPYGLTLIGMNMTKQKSPSSRTGNMSVEMTSSTKQQ